MKTSYFTIFWLVAVSIPLALLMFSLSLYIPIMGVYALEANSSPVSIDICLDPTVTCNDPEAIIREIALEKDFDAELLIRIATAESGMQPIRGKVTPEDRGYYQINSHFNPEVSDECANDLKCSTEWVIWQIESGNLWKWDASKYKWNI